MLSGGVVYYNSEIYKNTTIFCYNGCLILIEQHINTIYTKKYFTGETIIQTLEGCVFQYIVYVSCKLFK